MSIDTNGNGSPNNQLLVAISQRLSELSSDIRELRTHVDTKVEQVAKNVDDKVNLLMEKFVTKELYRTLEKRVADLESDRKKYIGIIVGAVIVAVLALIINKGDIQLR